MNEVKWIKSVTDCLSENYRIDGQLSRLPGENLNFLVQERGGKKHVLKIVDEYTPPDTVALENAVIEHAVAAGFRPRLPQIIRNIHGKIETRITIHRKDVYRARLIEFIPGIEMSSLSDISDKLLLDLGKSVADFNRVMADFDGPAATRSHRWNLVQAEQHESNIPLINEREKQDLLRWSYSNWRQAKGALAAVPWQLIHGDAHDENILVAGQRVVGLIDFGDCCHNPTVCDLAICLTYLMMRGEQPLRIAAVILEGYRRVRPLSAIEMELLYPLVCVRLAVSVCVANKRKTIDPENPNWFGGERAAWRLLDGLHAMGPAAFGSGMQQSR